jgi:3-methyl-2-oxobutanoate hydroxymethyltransferase
MFEKFVPSFVKRYAELAPQIAGAIVAFRDEVKGGLYPDAEHSFVMQGEVEELLKQGEG